MFGPDPNLPPEGVPDARQLSPLTRQVLAALPRAEQSRQRLRRRRRWQQAVAALAGSLGLLACLGSQTSSLVLNALAWMVAASFAWHGLVHAMLNGLAFVAPLSAASMLLVVVLLWQRLIVSQGRGLNAPIKPPGGVVKES